MTENKSKNIVTGDMLHLTFVDGELTEVSAELHRSDVLVVQPEWAPSGWPNFLVSDLVIEIPVWRKDDFWDDLISELGGEG